MSVATLEAEETKWTVASCKGSFWAFVQEFWEEVPGAGTMIANWHMEFLCDEMQAMAERVFQGLPKLYDEVVNISPGTSKSTICSILFPCWVWTRMPTARILTASHTDELVLDLANKARSVINSEKYKEFYPHIHIKHDQNNKGYYSNTLGGDRKTCTIGGKSPMGFHAHFLIVDDPIDPKKVLSSLELKTAESFMTNVLPTRKVDKRVSVTFLIMQRLHDGDPTRVMLDTSKKEGSSKTRHVCLPAELPKDEQGNYVPGNVSPPELAKHYIHGLMDISRLDRTVLQDYKSRLGAYGYAGQFLQSPVPPGGGMFKPQYFSQRVKAAPYDATRIRFTDRASTENGGCNTASVLMSKDKDGNYYVEHVDKGQWEPYERNQRMRATAMRDRARYGPKNEPLHLFEREGGSSGRDAAKGVIKAMAGFSVQEATVTGDKVTRAEPWSAQCAAKNVYIVDDGTWDIQSYIDEHCSFPLGKMKDQVDASSGAFNRLVGTRPTGGFRILSRAKDKNTFRIVVCTPLELSNFLVETKGCYMVYLPDPLADQEFPPHGIDIVTGTTILSFADIQPSEYQQDWEKEIPKYGETPDKLIMNRDHGKKFWGNFLKKRDAVADMMVICGEGRVPLSFALGVAEILRLHYDKSIYVVGSPDNKLDPIPKNRHVKDMVVTSRLSVV